MPIGSAFYCFHFARLQGLGVYLGRNDGAFADFPFNFLPFGLRCGCGRFFEVVVKIFHHRFQLQILSGLKGGGVF